MFRPMTALLLPLIPSIAAAADFRSEMDSWSAEGVVEVPLYGLSGAEGLPAVEVQVGERRFLFAIDPGLDEVVLAKATAAALGLDAKGDEEKDGYTHAKVAELRVGGLKAFGVDAKIAADLGIEPGPHQTAASEAGLVGFDGVLGLDAFEGLSWSLLRSTGTVRLQQAAAGGALADGAARLGRTDGRKVRTSKGTKEELPAWGAQVEVGLGSGQFGLLELRKWGGRVEAALVPEGAPRVDHGDTELVWLTVPLLGAEVASWSKVVTIDEVKKQYEGYPETTRVAVGRAALAGLDLTLDGGSRGFSVAAAPSPKVQDPLPWLITEAEAAVERALQPGAEGAAPDAAALAAARTRLAKLRLATGQHEAALTLLTDAAAGTPESCTAWLELGRAQRRWAPEVGAARAALDTAVQQYHQWWDWAPEVREALSAELKKAKKKDATFTFSAEAFGFVEVLDVDRRDQRFGAPAPLLPADGTVLTEQPASCHVVEGERAAVDLLAGDLPAVKARYDAQMDLDPELARVAGVAALAGGQGATAQGPIRQAIEVHRPRPLDPRDRVALGLAMASVQERAAADAPLRRAVELAPHELGAWDAWADNLIAWKGADAARAAVAEAAKARPDSLAGLATWARLAAAQGANDDLSQIRRARDARAAWWARLGPSAVALAQEAVVAHHLGEAERAASGVAAALAIDPNLPEVWAAQAQIATGPTAARAWQRAARLNPGHPSYSVPALTAPSGS